MRQPTERWKGYEISHMLYTEALTVRAATAPELREHYETWMG